MPKLLKTIYKINFYCNNCGHKWEGKVPKGERVEQDIGRCFIGSKTVICPNCSTKDIEVRR